MEYTSDPTRKKELVPSSVVCPMLNSSMRMKVTLWVHKVWETIEPVLGEIIEEAKLVKKFLKGLLRNKYIHIGRLKAYEERVKEETLKEGQGKLMFTSNNKQIHDEKDGSRGRGRSRVKGRRRGREGRERREGKRRKREIEKKRKKEIGVDGDKKWKRKEKERKTEKGKKGAVTDSWGKYGIIRETDMWNKRPEFTA